MPALRSNLPLPKQVGVIFFGWGGILILLAGCEPGGRPLSAPERAGPGVSFFGLADRAERVVYVIDTTGANTAAFPYVQAALLRSVESLQPTQRFSVVFFGAESPNMLKIDDRSRLVPADRTSRQAARQFILSHREQGLADEGSAWRGIRAALELDDGQGRGPQVAFLLTQRPWAEALAERIGQLNRPSRPDWPAPVRIHAVGFVNPETEPLLKRVAHANAGRFRFIDAVNLGKE